MVKQKSVHIGAIIGGRQCHMIITQSLTEKAQSYTENLSAKSYPEYPEDNAT